MSTSFSFPTMFRRNVGLFNKVEGKEAIKQNLRLLLLSTKTELLGDPYFGTNLQKLLFSQNDIILQDLIIDDIYSAIKLFMPECYIERKNITLSYTKGTVFANIKLTYLADNTTDLYDIVLMSSEEII